MPSGFQAIHTNGNYQIDGTYVNPCLLRKGTLTTSYSSYYRKASATLSITQNEVLALSSSALCAIAERSANAAIINTNLTTASSINYWIFGYPPSNNNKLGLQVFNDSGVLVFDALNKHLNVVSKLSGGGSGGVSSSLPVGRTYAVMLQQALMICNRGRWDEFNGNINVSVDCTRVSGGVVTCQTAEIMAYDGPVLGGASWDGTFSNGVSSVHPIIDVTGL